MILIFLYAINPWDIFVVGNEMTFYAIFISCFIIEYFIEKANKGEEIYLRPIAGINAMEEAEGYLSLKNNYNFSQSEISKKISKSRSEIANKIRLIKLPEIIQNSIKNNELYYGHARALLSIKNTGKMKSALDKVNSIGGYSFDWNDIQPMHEAGTHDIGLLAQEVQEVLPEAVCLAPFDTYDNEPGVPDYLAGLSKSGENYLTIQYNKVIPLLVNAIKELSAKVEALESE